MDNNKKKIYGTLILGIMFFIFNIIFTPNVLGDQCIDENTLRHTINGVNIDKICENGCDTKLDICMPSVTWVYVIVVLIIFALFFAINRIR